MRNYTPISSKIYLVLCLLLAPLASQAQTYCDPYADCSADDYIESFTTSGAITDINNTSTGCNFSYPSYTYYSGMNVEAVQGTTFSFEVTNGAYCCSEYFMIWVDWNQDGDFDDADEYVYESPYSSSNAWEVFSDNITVPIDATTGITRMRVMCSYNGVGDPCSVYGSLGEAEDYDFIVQPACETPASLSVSNVTSSSADFDWDAVSGVLGYEYIVDQSASAPTGSGTFSATNTASEAGLTSTIIYYVHVRTQCTSTDFSGWATSTFTTIFNPCPAPGGITFMPTGTSVADFSWTAVSGSGGYEYAVNSSGSAPLTSGTPTTATTANISGLIGGGTYYFFLRNACTAPSGVSDWTRFQFTMPECYKPSGILVTTLTDTSANFIWGVTSNANYYEYQVDPNYAPPASSSGFSSTTGMSAHVEGLIPQTQYYVHLRSRCFIADTSEWILDSLVTQMGCLRPDVRITGAQTNNVSALWDSVRNAIAYEYKVDNTIANPAFGMETTNTFTGPVTLAPDGRDYYLHVRAKCNSQFSFSQWVTEPLRTGAVNVFNITGEAFDINAYPNPVKDVLQISVSGQLNEGAMILLTDITGKTVVKTAIKTNVSELNLSGLAAGMYMLKYTDDVRTKVIKITKE